MNKKNIISEKELKYFSYSFKSASCLGKMYLLSKLHKRIYNVPGRLVISNCGTLTEKVSEFLDHLQPVIKSGKSNVKDDGDFLEKTKSLGRIPKDAFLVTADVVGLHPSMTHDPGLQTLYEKLKERPDKKVPSADLVDIAKFVLKNNLQNYKVKH